MKKPGLLGILALNVVIGLSTGQHTHDVDEVRRDKDCCWSLTSLVWQQQAQIQELQNRIAQVTPQRPGSCKEILQQSQNAPSGEYSIITSVGKLLNRVYCEMGLNGGGYTFLHPSDLPRLTNTELQAMFTDKSSFLMRLRKTDNTQPYGVLQQLPQYRDVPLKLGLNDYSNYAKPVNTDLLGQPFLYFAFLNTTIAANRNLQGLRVNGEAVSFVNGDANPNSYFALFPNFRGARPSNKIAHFPFGDKLFSLVTADPSRSVIPEDYFVFFEAHFGGGGTYTQTDGRGSAVSIASATIGFR